MADFNVNLTSIINRTSDDSITLNESITDLVTLLSMTIASIGIISNLTVVVVFLNQVKLRRKIPIIYIINQVNSFLCVFCVVGDQNTRGRVTQKAE